MNRNWDELLPIEVMILEVGLERAAQGDGSFYAYGISREFERSGRTSTLLTNGTMYKALRRMEANGWLTSYYEQHEVAEAEGKRPRRTLYEVTPEGAEAYRNAPRAAAQGVVVPTRQKSGVRVRHVVPVPEGTGP
jgi:PadR family transcriptional regulator, regulatory protein PadR